MAKKKYRDKDTEFNLSNRLIEAKYLLSPYAKDIMNLAVTRMERTSNPDAPLKADLYSIDLYKMFGTTKKNNITRDLNKVKDEIQSCKIVIEDAKGGFDSYVIAPTCRYHNGIFTLEFNSSLRNHTLILDNTAYTQVSLVSSSMLKSFFCKRIYEILKEEYYRLNPKDINEYIVKSVNLSEFRFVLGLADQNEPEVSKYINKCKREKSNIDWDYAYSLCTKKKHNRWDSLKDRILDVAQEEIGQFTEIRFEYEPLRGRSNKVIGLEFKIYPNQPSEEIIAERQRKMKVMKEGESDFFKQQNITEYLCRNIMDEFEDHREKFGSDEVTIFMNDAGGDEELVRWAIMDTDRYGEQNVVNNYVACVRDRIKNPNNYKKPVCVANGSVEKGEKIVEVVESYNREKENTALRVWNKAKEKPEFQEFLYYLQENNLTLELFEEINDPKDYFAEYVAWRNSRIDHD